MQFEDWEPYYTRILQYFGFSREMDEIAAHLLGQLAGRDDIALLEQCCRGRHVTVCGNAPSLEDELGTIRDVVFAADGAANVLYRHNIRPHAVFTDLDGATQHFIEMNNDGTIMVVHAHGDNIPAIGYWVPLFSGPLVATTQSRPIPGVHNFGGFSDGDRAVFAADAFGASSISFAGFDLDDTDVDPIKRGKLHWARTLLHAIGYDL